MKIYSANESVVAETAGTRALSVIGACHPSRPLIRAPHKIALVCLHNDGNRLCLNLRNRTSLLMVHWNGSAWVEEYVGGFVALVQKMDWDYASLVPELRVLLKDGTWRRLSYWNGYWESLGNGGRFRWTGTCWVNMNAASPLETLRYLCDSKLQRRQREEVDEPEDDRET
jgi:hypothetical protein